MNGQNHQLPRELTLLLALLREQSAQVSGQGPEVLPQDRAAVAALLAGTLDHLSLMLIVRTRREGDPWSGHLAFPGGRPHLQDRDHWHTAVRETREEVAIDLEQHHYLGPLPAVAPRLRQHRGPLIHPHLFWSPALPAFTPDPSEVDKVFTLPLMEFFKPKSFEQREFKLLSGEGLTLPCMTLPEGVLWGLTYVIAIQLLEQMLKVGLLREHWSEENSPLWWRGPSR